MEKPQFKLEVFEGPLDLLLHLISKHKLDIYDIPIFELIEQYTAYVRAMQETDLGVASEFLEMAARLVYIKTASLLPVHEEAEQLKKELEGELIEYRDAKLAAERLAAMAGGAARLVRAPSQVDIDTDYELFHELFELSNAYTLAAGRGLRRLPPPVDSFVPIISRTVIAVVDRIDAILSLLKAKKREKLKNIYASSRSRSELVASFLAILEMVRDKKAGVAGDEIILVADK